MSPEKSAHGATVAATIQVGTTAIARGLKLRSVEVASGGTAFLRSFMKIVHLIPKINWKTHPPLPHTHTFKHKSSAGHVLQ